MGILRLVMKVAMRVVSGPSGDGWLLGKRRRTTSGFPLRQGSRRSGRIVPRGGPWLPGCMIGRWRGRSLRIDGWRM